MVGTAHARRSPEEYEAKIIHLTEERGRLAADVERLEDDLARASILAAQDEEGFPTGVVSRLIAGENPVRVYRDHRGQTIRALSERTGFSIGYLSGIETGKRTGTVSAFKAIAEALAVDLDMLT